MFRAYIRLTKDPLHYSKASNNIAAGGQRKVVGSTLV